MNEWQWNTNMCAVFLEWTDSSYSLLQNDRLEFFSLFLDVFCQNVQLLLQLNSYPLHDGLVTLTTKPNSHPEDSLLRTLNKWYTCETEVKPLGQRWVGGFKSNTSSLFKTRNCPQMWEELNPKLLASVVSEPEHKTEPLSLFSGM